MVERNKFTSLPPIYLIRDGGEAEAVGYHMLARFERRLYYLGDQLCTAGEEEEKFGAHINVLRLVCHDEHPYLFTKRGATWVLRLNDVRKFRLAAFAHRRFPRAIASLEHDEFPDARRRGGTEATRSECAALHAFAPCRASLYPPAIVRPAVIG